MKTKAKGEIRFFNATPWALALVLLGSISCATAKIPSVVVVDSPPPLNVHAELSSSEIAAGTIARIRVRLPVEARGKTILGRFENTEFPFLPVAENDPDHVEAIFGVPYERVPGPATVEVEVGEGPEALRMPVKFEVRDGEYPSETLQVDASRVNPKGKKVLQRILREQTEVVEIYKKSVPQKLWQGHFELPIQSAVTSPFGVRRVYNGQLKNFHPGMDLRAPMNTPIYAPASGRVVLAKDLFYTGKTVMIDHGFGLVTLYAHMNRLKVHLGDSIKPKQLLGLSGKTGRVNGPHLHWQAVVHRVKVNPLGLVQVID